MNYELYADAVPWRDKELLMPPAHWAELTSFVLLRGAPCDLEEFMSLWERAIRNEQLLWSRKYPYIWKFVPSFPAYTGEVMAGGILGMLYHLPKYKHRILP